MLKNILLIASFTTVSLTGINAYAQTDSSRYNLGRIQLSKDFTQHITVKGDDLQKIPFTNLAEAINVWFNGAYSNPASLVYVVDGNLLTDVNQYSIFDIEEITLIQNAAVQLNGATQQQQVILITTKRKPAKTRGIEAAAQTSLVQREKRALSSGQNAQDYKSTNALFQQYYISGHTYINDINVGASVNYLRDVNPELYQSGTTQPASPDMNRWRFNGYLNTRLGKKSILDFTIGYVPQQSDYQSNYANGGFVSNIGTATKDRLFNSNVKLTTQISSRLTNQLRFGFNRYTQNQNEHQFLAWPDISSASVDASVVTRSKIFNLYDDLSYKYQTGKWLLTPALNFNFRYVNANTAYTQIATQGGKTQVINNPLYAFNGKSYLLTPNVSVNYADLFNITGGALFILNAALTANGPATGRALPFVSASVNASRLFTQHSPVSVRLYGSYALSNDLNDVTYNLSSFYAIYNQASPVASGSFDNLPESTYAPVQHLKALTIGTNVGFWQDKLVLSYNFDKRDNITLLSISNTSNSEAVTGNITTPGNYYIHRIGATVSLINTATVSWRSNFNATNLKQKVFIPATLGGGSIITNAQVWTGGWANRLQYRKVTAGADILYFASPRDRATRVPYSSMALQNVYVGYIIKTPTLKRLEVFATGRNLTQNNTSIFADYRRYVGLGVTAAL
ncbi:TonB-dependent receptor [Mucilaginibacter sp. Bleaf8]|uniref:hypothetical protein n=1 Tax=Mucilaginibacter sp. Bleaf8 TaxID=2834430 RepID=UPI001BCE44DB|nr:hypothetical protein [Mucilaginibacter sp. Bleaf8]MBS7564293.1 TonB-dependent receptor [Mucilaginibacter sp. Bleaf8]